MDEVATVTRTPRAGRRRERIYGLSFAGAGPRRAAEGLRRPALEVNAAHVRAQHSWCRTVMTKP
jgi:hypothetical protein